MDDDLKEFEQLLSDIEGDDFGDTPSAVEPTRQAQESARDQVERGLRVLWDPEDIFLWRDKAKVVGRAAAMSTAVLAGLALLLRWLGIRSGFIWTARVTARTTILELFAALGALGMYFVNNLLVAVLLGALLALLMRRGV